MNIKHLLFCFLFLFSFQINAQNNYFLGNPKITTFPEILSFGTQVMCIEQDNRGMIYFGTNNGFIEFDGIAPRRIMIEGGEGGVIRDMCKTKTGVIYLGGAKAFGYLYADSTGNMKYRSLLNKLDSTQRKEWNEITRVLATENEVYFVSSKKIFVYRNQKFDMYDNPIIGSTRFFRIDDHIVYTRNSGIYYFKDGKSVRLPFSGNIKGGIISILKINSEKIFLFSFTNVYSYNLNFFKEFCNKQVNDKNSDSAKIIYEVNKKYKDYPEKRIFFTAITPDSLIAIATRNGLYLLNTKAEVVQYLDSKNGLSDNCIYTLLADKNKNLWCGAQKGLSLVQVTSPLTFFDEKLALEGTGVALEQYRGRIYFGTFNGAYTIPDVFANNKYSRELIKLPDLTYSWGMTNFNDKFLLISNNSDIYYLKNDKPQQIPFKLKNATGSIISMKLYEKTKEHLIIGKQNYFAIVKVISENQLQTISDNSTVKGVLYGISEDHQGNIWLTTDFHGVYCIKFKNNDLTNYKIINYSTANGLGVNDFCYPNFIDKNIYITSTKGIYKAVFDKLDIDKDTIYKFEYNEDFIKDSKQFQVIGILKDSKKNLWFLTNKYIGIADSNKVFNPIYTKEMRREAWKWQIFDDVIYALSTTEIYRYDTKVQRNFNIPFNTLIRRVKIAKDSIIFNGSYFDEKQENISLNQSKLFKPVIKYKFNTINFDFSSTSFENFDSITFQYILEGFDKEWSKYSTKTTKEYTNLPEGKYTFKVKSKNLFNKESAVATYEFTILPPWHRTWWAYLIYVILSVVLVVIIVKLYTRRLIKQKEHLEQIVKERTAEVVQQKEEILTQRDELKETNAILLQQKEEIQAQSEELLTLNDMLQTQAENLEKTNKELEKLSIVARETDNAVFIMDKDGNFEWANEGFKNLYGISLDEFIEKRGRNLFKATSNENIEDIFKQCVINKKAVSYESCFQINENQIIWIQSTLTPILKDGEIDKLIAIDIDISKIKQAENEIRMKNENINASIRYAKTIQTTILPTEENISAYFKNFILFMPKDIISGDFFWHTYVNSEFHILAVADCTGHGVPGAFMSIICNRLLNEAVNEKKIYEPDQILSFADANLKHQLKQDQQMNNDGMDICMIKVNNYNNESQANDEIQITYCGAKRPIFYYNAQTAQITEFKTIRRSIGGSALPRILIEFKNQTLKIRRNDIIYLSSDGYSDQNNFTRNRLGTSAFMRLLARIGHLPIHEQKQKLYDEIQTWMTSTFQRDDITVMGIKF